MNMLPTKTGNPDHEFAQEMQQKVSGMQQINGEGQLAPDIEYIHSLRKLNNYDLNNNKQLNLCNTASEANKVNSSTAAYTGSVTVWICDVDWLLSNTQQLITEQWTELSDKVWTVIAVGSQSLHTVRTNTPWQPLYQFISIQHLSL